jgi:hypothetical protein
MNKSITLSSVGHPNTADFVTTCNPPLDLMGIKWNVSLTQLSMYNSFYNISDELQNNYFYYYNGVTWHGVTLESGQYNFISLQDHIHDLMYSVHGDATLVNNVLTYSINWEIDISDGYVSMFLSNSYQVDFTVGNIRNLFGFNSQVYTTSKMAENRAQILGDISYLCAHLDIISGNSIHNGMQSDVIHSFFPDAAPNGVLRIEPNNSKSIGITRTGQIDNIRFRISDNNNKTLNLRGYNVVAEFLLTPILK